MTMVHTFTEKISGLMAPSETLVTLPVMRMSMACNNLVIFAMMPDPKPDDIVLVFNGHRAIMDANPHSPEAANFLKMKRWMARVGFEKFIVFIGQPLDVGG
jgi:hypothetical protein